MALWTRSVCTTALPNPPADPSSIVMRTSCSRASRRMRSTSRGLAKRAFVAPLTSRGRALVALIHEEEARLVACGAMQDDGHRHVAQEGFFEMVPLSYFPRFPRIRQFQSALGKEWGGASKPSAPLSRE